MKRFQEFISEGSFDLVVGIDEITNLNALNDLTNLDHEHSQLEVKAFAHDLDQYTLHPKFSWFQNEDSGTLIIGSGNLTVNGLRNNCVSYRNIL